MSSCVPSSSSEVSGRGGERADVQPAAEAGEGEPEPAEDSGGAERSSGPGGLGPAAQNHPGEGLAGPQGIKPTGSKPPLEDGAF